MSVQSVTNRIAVQASGVAAPDDMRIASDDKDTIMKAGEHLTAFLPSGLIAWFIPVWPQSPRLKAFRGSYGL